MKMRMVMMMMMMMMMVVVVVLMVMVMKGVRHNQADRNLNCVSYASPLATAGISAV